MLFPNVRVYSINVIFTLNPIERIVTISKDNLDNTIISSSQCIVFGMEQSEMKLSISSNYN